MKRWFARMLSFLLFLIAAETSAQFNADRVLLMGRNALYYEDYVLSIQRFNMVINTKPHLAEAYFYRGLAKFYLEDYKGAEADCSAAIYRNPYTDNYYVLRGLCNIHLNIFDAAEKDYAKAIDINPLDASYWHNLVLCQINQSEYAKADSCLDIMIRKWPNTSENYTMRAQVKLAEQDTVTAEQWIDRAISVNAFDGSALSVKAMMLLQRNQYAEGEEMLGRAIVQMPRQHNLYLNRALARYHQSNLRGAMNDYDAALDLNPNSYVGHFNRGLLRAQVGDDNRAIEDFNFVIEKEPENFIAIYNRAILLDNIGDYRSALRDISSILKAYPQFWDGYLMRARIRRKVGDVYGAERDEFKVLKVRVEGVPKVRKNKKTRKLDDHDMDDYDALVVDDSQNQVQEYASAYRGKVQDNATAMQIMPFFVLGYFERTNAINHYMPYLSSVEEVNKKHKFLQTLHITNTELAVPESSLDILFKDIETLSASLDKSPSTNTICHLFHRAVDYYHVRDFESALTDVEACLDAQPHWPLALFLRAQLRSAFLMANNADLISSIATNNAPTLDVRIQFQQVATDLKTVTTLEPDNTYAYYNLGNVYMLLHDYDLAAEAYSNALSHDSSLPDAYFNRGIAYILLKKKDQGLVDLSQAGEYGLYTAYSIIKQQSTPSKKK